jgi:hypothetical protein
MRGVAHAQVARGQRADEQPGRQAPPGRARRTDGAVTARAGQGDRAAPARVAPTAVALLESARQGLADARAERGPGGRYVAAHLAALRAAAAVVAARPAFGTAPRRRGPHSVWELLPRVEPALAAWAAFFAASARKRAAAEAGLPRAVTALEAEDLVRDAETFVCLAEQALGLPGQPLLPLRSAS